jgi:predicted transcriptional regulator
VPETQGQSEDKTVRLSVNLAPDVADALQRLAKKKNVSLTEMVRRAISTENFIDEQVDKRRKILIADEDEKNVREVVFR